MMGEKENLIEALNRAKTLLRATFDLLQKADESPIVLDPLGIIVDYDGAECDGSCLKDDIEYWFDEFT